MFRLGTDRRRASAPARPLYDLPPGELLCPYHYEYGEEEWLLVLHGRPFLRTPEGTEELAPFDVAFFPRGPDGAHQVGNRTDEPARVLMWSNVVYPSATAYPDSDKVGLWTGVKPEDLIVERSSGRGLLPRREGIDGVHDDERSMSRKPLVRDGPRLRHFT